MVVRETVAIYQYPEPDPDELDDPDELVEVVVVLVDVATLPPAVADAVEETVFADVTTDPLALILPCDIEGIISTSSTVAPLTNISSELDSIWKSDPNVASCLLGTITIELIFGASALWIYVDSSV